MRSSKQHNMGTSSSADAPNFGRAERLIRAVHREDRLRDQTLSRFEPTAYTAEAAERELAVAASMQAAEGLGEPVRERWAALLSHSTLGRTAAAMAVRDLRRFGEGAAEPPTVRACWCCCWARCGWAACWCWCWCWCCSSGCCNSGCCCSCCSRRCC